MHFGLKSWYFSEKSLSLRFVSIRSDMKRTLSIFWLLALLLLAGCNDPKPVTDALHRAEALMNEYPDSAWAVLNTLSPDAMGQSRTCALYALLYTQAQDKTYRDETNDSLISIAVDYYRHTDDARHKFLSYYYKGRVSFNAKDYLTATSCYMEAEQLTDAVGDDYLTGLLYAELGRIYRLYYDYPKSLEAYQKAAECYERADKIRHRNYMWLNQTRIYRSMNENKESQDMLQTVLTLALENEDRMLIRNSLGDLIMLYVEQQEIEKADSLYKELLCFVDEDFGSSSYMVALTKMYLSIGNLAQAEYCLDKGWKRATNQVDSIALYVVSAELYSLQGQQERAYRELQKGMELQNQEARQALQQPVLTVQRDYLSERLDFEAYKLRTEKHLRILYILFFTLLLIVVVLFLSRKLKREKEKARKTIDDLNREMLQKDKESRTKMASLLLELENKDKETVAAIRQLRNELQNQEENYHRYMIEAEQIQRDLQDNLERKKIYTTELFKNWFEVVGTLVFLAEQKDVKESSKLKSIRKETDLMKEKYMVGNKAFRGLERLVNMYQDDAMNHFRREVSLADESDYRRVCYFFAGFPIQAIAWLMDEKVENVYQRRLRLRKFIASSVFAHKGLYERLLSK
jgi:hypothetical protein